MAILVFVIHVAIVGRIEQCDVAIATCPAIQVHTPPRIRHRVVHRCGAGAVDRSVVLRAGKNAIGLLVVRTHEVHLCDGNIVHVQPARTGIVRHEQPAVIAKQQALGIRRVDDEFVMIEMQRPALRLMQAQDLRTDPTPG